MFSYSFPPFFLFISSSPSSTPPACSPPFISRSRANSLRWWFLSFLRTRGLWRRLQPSRASSCPPALTTSLAAVSNLHAHLHTFIKRCSVKVLCDFVWCFSLSKVEYDHFLTHGVWLFPKKTSSPLQQHLSLNRKKQSKCTLPVYTFNLPLFISLSRSVHLASSFCLVYFLMYKSSKIQASCRTWAFFFFWLSRSGCVAMCCLPW